MNFVVAILLVLLGLSVTFSQLIVVDQCYNQYDIYCIYKWSVMNCASTSVPYNWQIKNSLGGLVAGQNFVALPGWQNGGNSICGPAPGGVFANTPWTVTVSVNGTVQSTAVWNGCTDQSNTCSPAGYDCVYLNEHSNPPPCPGKR